MSSWAAQQAIRNIVLVCVVGGGLYALYRFIDQQGRETAPASDEDCRASRREVLELCEPLCAQTGDSPMPVQVTAHGGVDPDCIDKCAMKNLRRHLPVCSSRR